MTESNAVTLTVDAAAAEIALANPTPTELTAAGGSAGFAATTNEPDGTVFYLQRNGAYTGLQEPSSGGAVSFTWDEPPNPTTVQEQVTFIVTDVAPPAAPAAPAPTPSA